MKRLHLLAAVLATIVAAPARAQSLEPRAYVNTPTGMNFFIAGYAYSTGGVVLDPAVPIEDADISTHIAVTSYARAFGLAGKSGKVLAVLPYGWLSGTGTISESQERRAREISGLGDALVRLSMNFLGAPALSPAEFKSYRQGTIVGTSLQVTAPVGQYDPDKLINLGTNRWSFKPELGVSTAVGPWTFEGALAVTFFTTNDEFFGGQEREQDPLYAVQAHVVRSFRKTAWLSLDATRFAGGQTTIDGVSGDDTLRNWRYGATGALPIDRKNSIKLYWSDGVSTRRGDDFMLLGAVWQYRWIRTASRGRAGTARSRRAD